jgi:hypothetical protein
MRSVLIGLAALIGATAASAQVYVHGYTTKNGTYVAPHYRSSPDSSVLNNWSTRGNVNPYTGQVGTRNPYSYSSPYTPRTYTTPSYGCLYCAPTPSQPQSSTDDSSDPY